MTAGVSSLTIGIDGAIVFKFFNIISSDNLSAIVLVSHLLCILLLHHFYKLSLFHNQLLKLLALREIKFSKFNVFSPR